MQKMRANIFTKRFDLQVYKKLIFMMKIMLRCKIKAGGRCHPSTDVLEIINMNLHMKTAL